MSDPQYHDSYVCIRVHVAHCNCTLYFQVDGKESFRIDHRKPAGAGGVDPNYFRVAESCGVACDICTEVRTSPVHGKGWVGNRLQDAVDLEDGAVSARLGRGHPLRPIGEFPPQTVELTPPARPPTTIVHTPSAHSSVRGRAGRGRDDRARKR